MSKTNGTPKPTALEDHRPLADSELDAVSGGWSLSGIPGAMPQADFTFAVDSYTKIQAKGAIHY